uniref:Uncharacterized protein n=1 Tax=Anguilla anguilla TaxID=7936 RepID=A0A0E9R6V5_ANGAN
MSPKGIPSPVIWKRSRNFPNGREKKKTTG